MVSMYALEHVARRTAVTTLMALHESTTHKEGHMKTFSAESLNLSHLNPHWVRYDPKNIRTQAIQVTPQNIGKLSLEFEEEIFYDAQGRPYFYFSADRFENGSAEVRDPSEVFVRLMDWIVPLRGEIHVYRDGLFQHTFEFENSSAHSRVLRDISGMPAVAQMTYADGSFEKTFSVGDHVQIEDTGDYGKVVVENVDRGDGTTGYEVELDNTGQKYVFGAAELQLDQYGPQGGQLSGPTGTGILPQVER